MHSHRRDFLRLAGAAAAFSLSPPAFAQRHDKPYVLCSTTQTADFARQVFGDRMEVKSVLAPGEDPHLYQLKPRDATLAAGSVMCIENGWHLEGKEWMKTLAENASKKLVTCVEGLTPLELEEDGETVHDPHAWFSPINAAGYVRNIFRAAVVHEPEHRREYEARTQLYLDQLRALHMWVKQQVQRLKPQQRVLVTSHDAFGYFCHVYDFTASAPAGWSTGQELGAGATAARRRAVVESIRNSGVPAIFVETSVNAELIQEIANDAGVRIGGELYSDSMGGPGTAGESYLGMMRENVLNIVNALSGS